MSLVRSISSSKWMGTAAGALAGGALVGAVVLGSAASASAQPASALASDTLSVGVLDDAALATLTDADAVAVKWSRLCARVPVAIQRVENVQKRFAADANTKGSVAYLQARIDKAKAAGKTDLVTVLEGRMVVRQDLQELLPKRLQQLQDAQELCAKKFPASSPAAS